MAVGEISNAQFFTFVDFATSHLVGSGSKAVAKVDDTVIGLGSRSIAVESGDKVGSLFRKGAIKTQNDEVRKLFRDSVAEMFGGEDRIPASVKSAMRLSDYGKGKPLTIRRIMAVNAEVSRLSADASVAFAEAKHNAASLYAKLSPQEAARVDELIEAAVKACIDDKDALAVVVKNIGRILVGGDSSLRSVDSVRGKVDGIVANMAEIRALAKRRPYVMEAGKAFLGEMGGKSVPPGVIGRIVGGVASVKIDCMKKLDASSTGLSMHKAVVQFHAGVQKAMISSGAEKVLEGGDELEPARNFVAILMLGRCGDPVVAKMQQALESEKAAKLSALYGTIAVGSFNADPGTTPGHISATKDQADVCSKFLNALKLAVDIKRGVPASQSARVREFAGHFDYGEISGGDILRQILNAAKERLLADREKFLSGTVKGDSEGAKVLRGIYEKKLGPEPYSPKEDLEYQSELVTTAKLNRTLALACKNFATGQEAKTPFALDIVRGMRCELPDGTFLPNDFEQARDALSRLVAGDANATYAGLDPKARNKVHIAMALISQETFKAGYEGHAAALDPKRNVPAYVVGGDQHLDTRSLKISLGTNGSLNLSVEHRQSVNVIQVGDEMTMAGPDSWVTTSFSFKISAAEFDRLAQADFSAYNDTPVDEAMEDTSGECMFERAAKAIDEQFRFGDSAVTCHVRFGAEIN